MSRNLKKKYKYMLDENDEDIIEQFKKCCYEMKRLYKTNIDVDYYIVRYNEYTSQNSLLQFKNIQEKMYHTLKSKYPDIDFGIRGRTKSPFSYFQKILNKLEDNPKQPVYVNDECANKIFIRSRKCKINEIGIDNEGPYIIYGKEMIYIKAGDCLNVNFNGRYYNNIYISSLSKSLFLKDDHIYVKTSEGFIVPIQDGILEQSSKEDLIPFCYKFRDEIDKFYENLNFELVKQADYIANKKESGYSSLQNSYNLKTPNFSLSTETQIKTADMEYDSKTQPGQKRSLYKPESRILSSNSIYKVPIYILTTAFPNIENMPSQFACATVIPNPEECWNYTFKEKKKDNPELYLELREKYKLYREKSGYKDIAQELDNLGINQTVEQNAIDEIMETSENDLEI